MMLQAEPGQANRFYAGHVALLLASYRRLFNHSLISADAGQDLARQAFSADFVLLSHDSNADPLFNYANQAALNLFEFSWQELIGMPSRFSAEPLLRTERERLLMEVAANGYIDDYSGVRIAKSGRRFEIKRAVVWNVYDDSQNYCGQAACFKDWVFLS